MPAPYPPHWRSPPTPWGGWKCLSPCLPIAPSPPQQGECKPASFPEEQPKWGTPPSSRQWVAAMGNGVERMDTDLGGATRSWAFFGGLVCAFVRRKNLNYRQTFEHEGAQLQWIRSTSLFLCCGAPTLSVLGASLYEPFGGRGVAKLKPTNLAGWNGCRLSYSHCPLKPEITQKNDSSTGSLSWTAYFRPKIRSDHARKSSKQCSQQKKIAKNWFIGAKYLRGTIPSFVQALRLEPSLQRQDTTKQYMKKRGHVCPQNVKQQRWNMKKK